jgi:glycosyltransferase involved in cell wall biosynthesis
MSEPLVSVFLPAFNQVAYVDEAIGSAVEQDYDNLEVLVGDDGSTDGTVDRILEWAARYPRRVFPVLGPHVGMTGNCNRIFARVRGKYIASHAGDDVFLPGKVKAQVEWLEADERRVVCGHAAEKMDAITGKTYSTDDERPLTAGRGAKRLIEEFGLLPDISVMGRRSAYPSYGYDERVGLVSAFKLNIDILASGGEYGYVPGVLARYRVHAESITQRSRVDPEIHRQFLEGYLIALAVTEANYPELAATCRKTTARLLFSEGRWRQAAGQLDRARSYYLAAGRKHLAVAPKAVAGYALTRLPASWRRQFEAIRSRRRLAWGIQIDSSENK